MDYKEKLKLAKEALDSGSYDKETIEYIFPELAESEDENIRKALIRFHKSTIDIDGIKGEDVIAWLEKQQKPVEDRYMEGYLNGINDTLKTQKSAAWSDEDRETIDYLIDYLESELDSSYIKEDKEEFTKEIELLKSLRPRNTWRPSDEQLRELRCVISGCSYDIEPLAEMEEQLKKLMEE